jgi:hypothetical protein
MEVGVRDGLSGRRTDVDAEVETVGVMLFDEPLTDGRHQRSDGRDLLGRQGKEVGLVAARDHERVARTERKGIAYRGRAWVAPPTSMPRKRGRGGRI